MSFTVDAWAGRRVPITRHLVCAMQGQFPVLARGTTDDQLACVFRVGAGHYGLQGTLATAYSTDGGISWSSPREVAPRGDDVRNPAFAIIGTRWILAYWQAGAHCYPEIDGIRKWQSPRAVDRHIPDMFVIISDDRGATWSPPRPYASDLLAWLSPFGRIISVDDTLLLSAYGASRTEPKRIDAIVLRSTDGGTTWGNESLVLTDANETTLCLTPSGLVAAARRTDTSTALVRSSDAGHTWTAPTPLTREMEHPADLCLLRNQQLLVTYGRRIRPLGAATKVSLDDGQTFTDHEVLLAGDGVGQDIGYPSTVQLSDGTLVTVLYFARGSAGSEIASWGETSCQALRYPESLVTAP